MDKKKSQEWDRQIRENLMYYFIHTTSLAKNFKISSGTRFSEFRILPCHQHSKLASVGKQYDNIYEKPERWFTTQFLEFIPKQYIKRRKQVIYLKMFFVLVIRVPPLCLSNSSPSPFSGVGQCPLWAYKWPCFEVPSQAQTGQMTQTCGCSDTGLSLKGRLAISLGSLPWFLLLSAIPEH